MATTRRADTFTADGKPSDEDTRENGPTLSDEHTALVERATFRGLMAGQDAADRRCGAG
jgi:hypothetical protein